MPCAARESIRSSSLRLAMLWKFWRDRLVSPYDTDARHGLKRGMGWCGYKIHVTETCDAGAPHLINHVITTDATVTDTETTETVHQGLAARELVPEQHLVDAGYVTATHIVPPATSTTSAYSARSAQTPITAAQMVNTSRRARSASTGKPRL
jgi:hypothetical protein